MKNASAAAQAILAAGQYISAELYILTPKYSISPVYFTDFDQPLSAAIQPSNTVNVYATGLTVSRGDLVQKAGTDGAEFDLTIAPQTDSGVVVPLVNGYSFLQACRMGLLDGAILQMAKLFMNYPAAGAALDTSPKAVSWFLGVVGEVQAGRLKATIKASSPLALMTVQMPRSAFQVGCAHVVYDIGCDPAGTVKSGNQKSGTITAVHSASNFDTSLTQVDGYFSKAPGRLTFTSGAHNGISGSVKQYLHASGNVQLFASLPVVPSVGDAFNILPGCDHMLSTCSNNTAANGPTFNNRAHFKGFPFIPTPETMIDGGTSAPPAQIAGSQAGQIIGSPSSAKKTQPSTGGGTGGRGGR